MDTFAESASASTWTRGKVHREDKILMVSAVVRRIPHQRTVGRTFESSMTWLVPGSIILYESKVSSIVILVKIAFCINIEQDMNLFLWINLDMVVKVRIKVGVVLRPRTTSPGLGLGDQVCVWGGLLGSSHCDHPRSRGCGKVVRNKRGCGRRHLSFGGRGQRHLSRGGRGRQHWSRGGRGRRRLSSIRDTRRHPWGGRDTRTFWQLRRRIDGIGQLLGQLAFLLLDCITDSLRNIWSFCSSSQSDCYLVAGNWVHIQLVMQVKQYLWLSICLANSTQWLRTLVQEQRWISL